VGVEDLTTFVRCKECGKKLICRLPNGLWYFAFGKKIKTDGLGEYCPVEIYIHGSLKIRCIGRSCRAFNILHYFPNTDTFEHAKQSDQPKDNQRSAESYHK